MFTPNGNVKELPAESTDFAYKVYSDISKIMVGALVNNNILPFTYELKTNDILKNNTIKKSTPSR